MEHLRHLGKVVGTTISIVKIFFLKFIFMFETNIERAGHNRKIIELEKKGLRFQTIEVHCD